METKISFVVPCYGIREYIIRCLTSLVNQNIPSSEYEIIVVNDSSPDDCLELVTEFAKSHVNVRIHTQEHQGVSEARNNGFRLAKGQYIWFVDGDDWIAENCLKDLWEIISHNDLDMFCVAPSIPYQSDFHSVYNKKESISPILSGKAHLLRDQYVIGIWAYIFNANFLRKNKLSFMKGVYFEDDEFIPRALYNAEKVAFLETFSVYFYFTRLGSICNSFSQKHIGDYLEIAKSLHRFTHDNLIEPDIQAVFYRKVGGLVLASFNMLARSRADCSHFSSYLQKAKQYGVYPLVLPGNKINTTVLFFLWNHFPMITYKIKKRFAK